MRPIHSGTTTERIVRSGLMVLLFGAFAIAYLLDGFGGYARDNVRRYCVDGLGLTAEQLPEIDPTITRARALELQDKFQSLAPSLAELKAELGEPALEHGSKVYFFGPGGVLWRDSQMGVKQPWGWDDGRHTEMDIRMQQWIAYVLSALALVFIIHLIRVLTTRAILSEEGLKLRGHPVIAFSAMRALHGEDYKRRGWVELEYEGGKGIARLDDYVIKEFKPILAEICERCGFVSPVELEEAEEDDAVPPSDVEELAAAGSDLDSDTSAGAEAVEDPNEDAERDA